LLFLHEGQGEFFCDYGHMSVRAGDYVIIPRGAMWRLETQAPMQIMMIESTGDPYSLPDRGIIGRHAPFDPGVFGRPALDEQFRAQPRGGEWRIHVKRANKVTKVSYPFNPLDTIGWKGDLYPVRLNIEDIFAITSDRVHL